MAEQGTVSGVSAYIGSTHDEPLVDERGGARFWVMSSDMME
jgi:hypothetical protein